MVRIVVVEEEVVVGGGGGGSHDIQHSSKTRAQDRLPDALVGRQLNDGSWAGNLVT